MPYWKPCVFYSMVWPRDRFWVHYFSLYIYINDLPNCLHQGEAILYADDTTLVLDHANYNILIGIGNAEIANLYDWICANKLSLNAGKTKTTVYRTSRRHLRGPLNVLTLNGKPIDMVENHIFWGWFSTKTCPGRTTCGELNQNFKQT